MIILYLKCLGLLGLNHVYSTLIIALVKSNEIKTDEINIKKIKKSNVKDYLQL